MSFNLEAPPDVADPELTKIWLDSLYEFLKHPAFHIANFGIPADGNYTEFEEDGTMVMNGDATVFEDFNFPVIGLGRGASLPDIINLNATSIKAAAFDGVNTTEEVYGFVEFPHAWKVESVIQFHVHWLPTTANVGNVNWQLEYTITEEGDTEPASTTINIAQAAGGVAWKNIRTNFADIVTTGKGLETQFSFRFFRDPTDTDTYGFDAAVKTIGLHVEMDMSGSRQINTK